jgi:Tfp pilus assembly protein PilV
MSTLNGRYASGGTLIEVMLAVALTAVTALGLIATQLWMARHANAMAVRERAAWVADSLVEAMHGPWASSFDPAQWQVRVASILPRGQASVIDQAAGVSSARVTWAALRETSGTGDVMDMPESCGGVTMPTGTSCIAIAFAK